MTSNTAWGSAASAAPPPAARMMGVPRDYPKLDQYDTRTFGDDVQFADTEMPQVGDVIESITPTPVPPLPVERAPVPVIPAHTPTAPIPAVDDCPLDRMHTDPRPLSPELITAPIGPFSAVMHSSSAHYDQRVGIAVSEPDGNVFKMAMAVVDDEPKQQQTAADKTVQPTAPPASQKPKVPDRVLAASAAPPASRRKSRSRSPAGGGGRKQPQRPRRSRSRSSSSSDSSRGRSPVPRRHRAASPRRHSPKRGEMQSVVARVAPNVVPASGVPIVHAATQQSSEELKTARKELELLISASRTYTSERANSLGDSLRRFKEDFTGDLKALNEDVRSLKKSYDGMTDGYKEALKRENKRALGDSIALADDLEQFKREIADLKSQTVAIRKEAENGERVLLAEVVASGVNNEKAFQAKLDAAFADLKAQREKEMKDCTIPVYSAAGLVVTHMTVSSQEERIRVMNLICAQPDQTLSLCAPRKTMKVTRPVASPTASAAAAAAPQVKKYMFIEWKDSSCATDVWLETLVAIAHNFRHLFLHTMPRLVPILHAGDSGEYEPQRVQREWLYAFLLENSNKQVQPEDRLPRDTPYYHFHTMYKLIDNTFDSSFRLRDAKKEEKTVLEMTRVCGDIANAHGSRITLEDAINRSMLHIFKRSCPSEGWPPILILEFRAFKHMPTSAAETISNLHESSFHPMSNFGIAADDSYILQSVIHADGAHYKAQIRIGDTFYRYDGLHLNGAGEPVGANPKFDLLWPRTTATYLVYVLKGHAFNSQPPQTAVAPAVQAPVPVIASASKAAPTADPMIEEC